MNRHEATIFRGGAIIRTGCALIALSEGPCGKPVGCSTAAANNRGTPCADCIGYPSTETIAGHFSENDHRQFRLIRSDHSRQSACGLIVPSLLADAFSPVLGFHSQHREQACSKLVLVMGI